MTVVRQKSLSVMMKKMKINKPKESNSDLRKIEFLKAESMEGETDAAIERYAIVKSMIDNLIQHMFVNTQVFREDKEAPEKEAEEFKIGPIVLEELTFQKEDLNTITCTRFTNKAATTSGLDLIHFDVDHKSDESPPCGPMEKNIWLTDGGPVTRSRASKRLEKDSIGEMVIDTRSLKAKHQEANKTNRKVLTGCKTVKTTAFRMQEYDKCKGKICDFGVGREGKDVDTDDDKARVLNSVNIVKSVIDDVIEETFIGINEGITSESGSLKTKCHKVVLGKREICTRSQSAKISKTKKMELKPKGSEGSCWSPLVNVGGELRLESGLGIQFKTEDFLLSLEK